MNRFVKPIIYFLVPLAICLIAYSQNTFDDKIYSIIKNSLKTHEMSFGDLWLPQPTFSIDYHKLKFQVQIHEQPLSSFDLLKYHSQKLLNLKEDNIGDYFSQVFSEMNFKEYRPYYFDNVLSAKEIDAELKINTDSAFGIAGGQIFRLYVSPFIQINRLLKSDFLHKHGAIYDFLTSKYEDIVLGKLNHTNTFYNLPVDSQYKVEKDFFEFSQSVSRSNIYNLGISLYQTLLQYLNKTSKNMGIVKNSIRTTIINTPYGRMALGGPGADVYEGDFAVIIDVGGNDKYNLSNLTKEEALSQPVRFIVDYEGDDIYTGGDYSLGGTAFGINILLDAQGNDRYIAGNFSIGSAVFGVGILHDMGGSDIYKGKYFSEGASSFGIGLLLDDNGNDFYTIDAMGQGLALTRGFASLVDCSGNDNYRALTDSANKLSFAQGVSLGFEPYASGGIGLLIDGKGDDKYSAGMLSQGFGYFKGMGALCDLSGNDSYTATQFSQAAAINCGIGILFDSAGNDEYNASSLSQAFASGNSFACLLDENGNDKFILTDNAQKPDSGLSYPMALMIDGGGSDNFLTNCNPDSLKYFNIRNYKEPFSLFISDTNFLPNTDSCLPEIKGVKHRANIEDASDILMEARCLSSGASMDSGDTSKMSLPDTIPGLYNLALSLKPEYQNNIDTIIEKISVLQSTALYLSNRLSSSSMQEKRILKMLLLKMFREGSESIDKLIIDSLQSENYNTLKMCTEIAGSYKIPDAYPLLLELLNNKAWEIRCDALNTLGKSGNQDYAQSISVLFNDKNPYVRAAAAKAIGTLLPEAVLDLIHPAFFDENYIVRYEAFRSLAHNRRFSINILLEALVSDIPLNFRLRFAGLIPLSKPTRKDFKNFLKTFDLLPYDIKIKIYGSIFSSNNKFWVKKLRDMKKVESNSVLRENIKTYLESKGKKGKKNGL